MSLVSILGLGGMLIKNPSKINPFVLLCSPVKNTAIFTTKSATLFDPYELVYLLNMTLRVTRLSVLLCTWVTIYILHRMSPFQTLTIATEHRSL